jgi:poly(3-hydroxyoctanoate) depolymerase
MSWGRPRIDKIRGMRHFLTAQIKGNAVKKGRLLNEARAWGSGLLRGRRALADADLNIRYAEVHGIRLRYVHSPGAGQPLLFCNGIGANLELVLPFIEAMRSTSIVAFDVPGCGGSPTARFWPSFPVYARLAVGLLDHLGLLGPFNVAGVSWGGGLAQTIARDYPKRVSRLILMATAPGVPMFPGRLSAHLKMITPQRYLSRTFMARNAATLYGGELRNRPDRAIEYSRFTRAPTRMAYLQQLAAISLFSSWPWLHRIRCPALVLNGDDDPLIRTINARLLAALLPRGHLELIKGGGHLFMLFSAHETARLIQNFITSSAAEADAALSQTIARMAWS